MAPPNVRFSVEPGDHHVCADWQSSIARRARLSSAVDFQTQAGQSYYFRLAVRFGDKEHPDRLRLEQVDNAEGAILVSNAVLSTSHPKK
jgi:hypothetical protein